MQHLVGDGHASDIRLGIGKSSLQVSLVLGGVMEGELDEGGGVCDVVVGIHVVSPVDGHEIVGHDTAAAIDLATFQCVIYLTGIQMDTVGAFHLAVEQPFIQILVIGFGAVMVFTLDATAAGRVVAGGRQADRGIVGQVELPLHQSFAERPTTHDNASVVVLDSAGDNFAGGGAEVVDQNHHPALLEVALTSGVNGFGAHLGPLDGDDFLVIRQKFIANADGCVQEAAGVGTQIHHQGRHPLRFQFADGVVELPGRGASELVQLDVAGVRVHHVRHIHRISRDDPASNLIRVFVLEARTQNPDFHLRAFLSA